ncbi:MAG: hypothetical protein LBI29_03485 [Rickettsiales bacterium]|jgi:hypothetical protein|nr:hypothetical protein [Rickettsiales bacterium]
MNNGALIMLSLGLMVMTLYLVLFGFSHDFATKMGQYAALIVISYCIIDEIFREH